MNEQFEMIAKTFQGLEEILLSLIQSPSPRDVEESRLPSSA